VSNVDRRNFVNAVENELCERREEWKMLWEETTIDKSWSMLNGVLMRHAKGVFEQIEHRDSLYVQIEAERDELRRHKHLLLEQRYVIAQSPFFQHKMLISESRN
jgi:uncharacterized protein YydD (DUF2326 family)